MDSLEIARTINNEDKKLPSRLKKRCLKSARPSNSLPRLFSREDGWLILSAGTSGRLGVLDASECWPTFGVEHGMVCGFIAGGDNALRFSVENSEDSAELGLADLKTFNPTPMTLSSAFQPTAAPLRIDDSRTGPAGRLPKPSASAPIRKQSSNVFRHFINPVVGEKP
ncbi:MAG: hypothetical protein ACLU99_10310 [Alphaproteobacteria bacterium]